MGDTVELTKAKLAAEEKVLEHLQKRLNAEPGNAHVIFLIELHQEKYRALKLQLQEHNCEHMDFADVVESYMNDMSLLQPISQALPVDDPRYQELKTWEELHEKAILRLKKRPGDPVLIALIGEHQNRIDTLKSQLGLSEERNTSTPKNEPVSLAQKETPLIPMQKPQNAQDQIHLELNTWQNLLNKTQARYQKQPELVHLKPLMAEYESKILALEARLKEKV